MPPRTKAAATEEKKATTRKSVRGLPPGKPGDYRAMRVFPSDQAGPAEWIKELIWEEWKSKTWDELGEYVRSLPGIGNNTVSVRCYGGPKSHAWFIPKKTAKYADPGQTNPGTTGDLYRKIFELENELKEKGNVSKTIKRILAGAAGPGGIDEAALRRLMHEAALDAIPGEDEEEEEEKSPLREALDDLEEMLGPELYLGLKTVTTQFLFSMFPGSSQMPQAPQNGQSRPIADPPQPADVEVDILFPIEIVNEMNAIDWERTDYNALIQMLRKFGAGIGVFYLE